MKYRWRQWNHFGYAIAHPIKCPKFEKLNFKNYCMIKCLLGSVAPDCSINLPNLKHSRTRYLLAWSNFWNNLTGQLPYQCNICLKRFRLWSTMRKHTVRCTAKNSVKLEMDDNIAAATDVVADNIQGDPFASVTYAFDYIQSSRRATTYCFLEEILIVFRIHWPLCSISFKIQ